MPEGPGVTLASIIVVSHFGQVGREIWNMVLRLGTEAGAQDSLSPNTAERWGGDGRTRFPLGPGVDLIRNSLCETFVKGSDRLASSLRLQPDPYPFYRYVQCARAGPYGWDRPLQLRCDKMNGRIGLDQGFEAGILFRGPFAAAVFGHRVICPSFSARSQPRAVFHRKAFCVRS
jgi:hypothetical protein